MFNIGVGASTGGETSLLAPDQCPEFCSGILDPFGRGGSNKRGVPNPPVQRPGVIAEHDALHGEAIR